MSYEEVMIKTLTTCLLNPRVTWMNCNLEKMMVSTDPAWRCPHQEGRVVFFVGEVAEHRSIYMGVFLGRRGSLLATQMDFGATWPNQNNAGDVAGLALRGAPTVCRGKYLD